MTQQGLRRETTDENEPPVDVVVQELIEDLEENEEGKAKDNDANKEDTASNWEEAAAAKVFSLLISAFAQAAAAHETAIAQSFVEFVFFFFLHHHLFGLFFLHHLVHHHWSFFVCHLYIIFL